MRPAAPRRAGPPLVGRLFERVDEFQCGTTNVEIDDVDSADAETDFAAYDREVEAARSAVADLPLDHVFRTRRGADMDLRWVYVHMIEEYARHNGHADLLRELIDGSTGD